MGDVRRLLVGAVVVLGCTVGDGSEKASSFGSMTVSPTASASASASGSASDTDDEESSSGSVSMESTTTGEPTPTSAANTGTDETSGPSPTTAAATGMDSGGEQPDTGQYSPCMTVAECVGQNVCMTVDDNGDMSGFCSQAGCVDPLANCEATPGGDAVPICYPADLMTGPDMICALSCANGETCPAPMTCHPSLPDGAICS